MTPRSRERYYYIALSSGTECMNGHRYKLAYDWATLAYTKFCDGIQGGSRKVTSFFRPHCSTNGAAKMPGNTFTRDMVFFSIFTGHLLSLLLRNSVSNCSHSFAPKSPNWREDKFLHTVLSCNELTALQMPPWGRNQCTCVFLLRDQTTPCFPSFGRSYDDFTNSCWWLCMYRLHLAIQEQNQWWAGISFYWVVVL